MLKDFKISRWWFSHSHRRLKSPMMLLPSACSRLIYEIKNSTVGDFPGGPVAGTPRSQFRDPGSIPGRITRSHLLQLRVCLL